MKTYPISSRQPPDNSCENLKIYTHTQKYLITTHLQTGPLLHTSRVICGLTDFPEPSSGFDFSRNIIPLMAMRRRRRSNRKGKGAKTNPSSTNSPVPAKTEPHSLGSRTHKPSGGMPKNHVVPAARKLSGERKTRRPPGGW